MVFVPRFSEAAEAQIVENLMTVTHRDMKAALDYFYAADNLPDFALMTDGEVDVFTYPFVVFGVSSMESNETDDIDEQSFLAQEIRVGVGMAVKATTLKAVRALARKYIRAFKAVVRSASAADLLPSTARVLVHRIQITHRYFRHGTKDTDVIQPVEFDIRIQYGET